MEFLSRSRLSESRIPRFLATIGAVLGVLTSTVHSVESGSRDAELKRIRSIFTESTRAEVRYDATPKQDRNNLPSGYTVSLPLLKVPVDLLAEAIDQSIRSGDREEVAGALATYNEFVFQNRKIPLNPAYLPILRDRLIHDDLSFSLYTTQLAWALRLYPSKETLILLVDLIPRLPRAEQREQHLYLLSDLVGVDIPISTTTTPLEKERILSSFQSWVERNKDRFEFDQKGRARLAGGDAGGGPRLSAGDRERIRKDPACVLRLIQGMLADSEEVSQVDAKELVGRCGAALLGEEGAKMVLEAMEQPPGTSELSWDLQARLGSVQGRYPVMDAVLLAIAYVAAYEQDPAARSLARQMLHDLASPEIARVLKGEPRIVHQKIKELDNEVASGERR